MGFDCNSGMTKGKCTRCRVVWYWPRPPVSKLKLKDALCPNCGSHLTPTVHYMKRLPWKLMPVAQRSK
jgi:hypothetical protein